MIIMREHMHTHRCDACAPNNASVLGARLPTQEGIQEWQRLWDRVVIDSRVSWEGSTYSYTDVCTPVSSIVDGCRVGRGGVRQAPPQ